MMHSDKIVAHINGHDHQTDLRFHSGTNWFNKEKNCLEQKNVAKTPNFFNQIIVPGMTPNAKFNPGYMRFTYKPTLAVLADPTWTYIQIPSTYGKTLK